MRSNTSRASRMSRRLTNIPDRFFLLRQGCHLLLNLAPSASLQYPSVLADVTELISSTFLFIYSPAAVHKTGFLINFAILGEQLSSASNENKCGVLNLSGRQVFCLSPGLSSAICIFEWTLMMQIRQPFVFLRNATQKATYDFFLFSSNNKLYLLLAEATCLRRHRLMRVEWFQNVLRWRKKKKQYQKY